MGKIITHYRELKRLVLFLFSTLKEMIKTLKPDKLESLRDKLNQAVSDDKSLISKEILELSQKLDELIVLEYKSRIKKKVVV